MIRIVQAGMGGFGRNWATEMIPQVTDVEVVARADVAAASREKAITEGLVAADRCYETVEAAIEATDPDAVLVTANLIGHVPAVRAGLQAGKHVLVEKPFAPTVAEARELVDLAASAGVMLMVSQNYRFFPAVRAVQQLIADGGLGALHAVELDFRRFSGTDGHRGPHHYLDEPLLVDMSIHHFDLMRAVLGRDATAITCHTWDPEWTLFSGPSEGVALVGFGTDLSLSYRGSWISHGSPTTWAGAWRMEMEHGEIAWTSRGDGTLGWKSDEVWVRRKGRRRRARLPEVPMTDRAGSLTEFVTALKDGREPETSGRDNLSTLALTYAAVEAASTGRQVTIT
ncbi:MAG: Gfo/Idh/MocA family protein [Mycobacteriales bacterium]